MATDGSTTPLLKAVIVLVVLSALYSATETAYTSLNAIKLKSLAIKDKRYQKVLSLYERYDKLLTTILIGNNIVNLTASSLALLFFQQVLAGNVNLDPSFISTAVITVVVLLFGEITPKFVSKAYPEKVALSTYWFITACYYLFYPLNLVLIGYKKLINLLFHLDREDTITDDELITIVNEAEEDGTLKEDESVLIKSAIEFDDLEVKDILIPRINVIAVPDTATVEEIKKVFEHERYSRIPVYSGNIDSVIGFIHEKDFYRNMDKPNFSIKGIMQDVVNVVEHTKISVLLRKLQAKKIHMAVVLDEYGGTLGIVTMEDILEELVGDIWDETDEIDPDIVENEDGSLTVDGTTKLDDLLEYVEISDPELEDYVISVSGYITEVLDDYPEVGDTFQYKNLMFTILETDDLCAEKLRIDILPEEKEEEE